MNSFLDRVFLANTLRDYLWVAGIILFVLVLNRLISKYIAILLTRAFKRIWKNFDQQKFVDLIIHPLGIFSGHHGFDRCPLPPELSTGAEHPAI